MLVDLAGPPLGDVAWNDILVPLAAAAFGAAIGATGSRHLRRQELYVEAAQKINGYMDDAVEALNGIDREADFDVELPNRAKQAVNLARFHSKRLESDEVSNRLAVTDFVLWDVINDEDYRGLRWVRESINDVMQAVVEFMILPRFGHRDGISEPFRQTSSRTLQRRTET